LLSIASCSACDSFGSLFFFDEVEAAACFDALSLSSLFFRLSARSFILASRREDLSAPKPVLEGDDYIVSSAINGEEEDDFFFFFFCPLLKNLTIVIRHKDDADIMLYLFTAQLV